MRDDPRYAYRRLRRQPAVMLAILITLTLAIAAVTVVIAVADAVILRPLPYPGADRIAVIWEQEPDGRRVLELAFRNYVD